MREFKESISGDRRDDDDDDVSQPLHTRQVALRISRQLLDEVVEHARADAPHECCGMIASRDGEAVAVHRARNAAKSALRYVMDPEEQFQLQNAIDDAGLDLGAIYHSHTRSDPVPSQTDINLAKFGDTDDPAFPGTLYLIVGVKGPEARSAAVVDRGQRGRAGRVAGDGMTGALVCPACDAKHDAHERFCETCGLPLVHVPGSEGPRKSELAIRARKVRPGYAEGPLVRAAWARNQAEADLIQGLLLEEGIPSLARRSGGFDVPDFLAAGPRDILVPSSGAEAAREMLGDGRRRLPEQRYSPRMRALAMTLAVVVFTVFAASIAVPSSTSPGLDAREVRAPRFLGVADRARERDLQRAQWAVRVRAAGERDARSIALLAREQFEDRAAEQQRVRA